jgi:two-component system chemotaxis sensor kinase CheA
MINYQLFDTLLEPVFIVNRSTGVVYANETAAIISGQNLRRLMKNQTPFDQVFSFSEPLDFLKQLESVVDPTPYKELNFTNNNGEQGKVQITAQKMYYNVEEEHWIIFFRDVTLEERLQKKYKAELESKETYILELQKAKIELENYSQNLEKMVQERTAELSRLNQTLSALLDSLGQGFFIFDQDGHCHDVFSKACLDLLEKTPAQQKVWNVLNLPENKVDGFKKWMSTAFSEMLPFEDLAPLAPQSFQHSEARSIQLEYFPLRSEDSQIQSVVVMATDRTDLVAAQKEAEVEKSKVQQVLKIIQNKKQISLFISETQSQLTQLHQIKNKPVAADSLETLKRLLHTLKGNAALYSIQSLADRAHHFETLISEAGQAPLLDWTGTLDLLDKDFQSFLSLKNELLPAQENEATELTIKDYFLPFESEIQKISLQLNKKVKPLAIDYPEKLDLDERKYAPLFSSMIHFMRNSLDHGLELPNIRTQKGKDEFGQIKIEFKTRGPSLEIHISDDGAGLNYDRLRSKAKEKGYPAESMSEQQLALLIFEASFSTQENVTEISGRGVGLDAVKENVKLLHGQIEVSSVKDQGTRFKIAVPLFKKSFKRSSAA